MNTPIISISDDQNTITHESGVVVEFVKVEINCSVGCKGCVYHIDNNKCMQQNNHDVVCMRRAESGIFKLKQ